MPLRLLSILILLFSTLSIATQVPPPQKYVLGFYDRDVGIVQPNPLLNLGSSFTLETWIFLQTPPTGPYEDLIMGNTIPTGDPGRLFSLEIRPDGRPVFFQTTGQPGSIAGVIAPNALPLGRWIHLAGTLNSGIMRIYVNGQLANSATSPGPPAALNLPFSIGARYTAGNNAVFFGVKNAYLRQARVWNRALTQAEIANTLDRKLPSNEPGMVAQWMLDNVHGKISPDTSANGLHLALGLSPTQWDIYTPLSSRAAVVERGPFFSAEAFRFLASEEAAMGRLIDFDGDNDLDLLDIRIYSSASGGSPRALRNNGGGIFTDATTAVLGPQPVLTTGSRDLAIADFNGDGLKDLFSGNSGVDAPPFLGGQSHILMQTSAGQMLDETATRLPTVNAFTHSVAAADIDADGDIDIYMGNTGGGPNNNYPPELYINNGSGVFTANRTRLPTFITSRQRVYLSCEFIDVNNDGRPDLYLGAHDGPPGGNGARDTVLLNSASGNFTEATPTILPPRSGGPAWGVVSVEPEDLNNDGYKDIILSVIDVAYASGRIQILLNNGNGTFRDGTAGIDFQPVQAAASSNTWTWWTHTGDFNRDGKIDFVTSPDQMRAHLYLNLGQARFADYSELLPLSNTFMWELSQEWRPGDLDGDSDVDILAGGFNGFYEVLRNIKPFSVAPSPFDFDGDQKTDLSVFRPNGASSEWWWNRSSNGGNAAVVFGANTDTIVPSDYTGDGKTDIAFWRPSNGNWFVLRSEDFSFFAFPFGANGDVPVPADYDGDGKADSAVFRASAVTWFINKSSGGTDIIPFGSAGDKPVPGDFDGDGKGDLAVFRPNGGTGTEWWVRRSSNASVFALQFGTPTDKAVPGDYTSDGKTDVAFWRPANGNWFVLRSEDFSFFAFPFGANGDTPVPGDYDGDGRWDAGVFRPSNNTWFVQRTTAGTLIQTFGITGDLPLPNAYVR